ncbi:MULTISPECIES: hypothetical protein [Catellatospora]|uniref:hypothetical protein n=1 Tax=Catellatospora TaxID=53365 RepID=UPI0012D3FDC7|nr:MULTISPECIES: hypothetical protein [Catellatospora]
MREDHSSETPAADETAEEVEQQPMNRAERRAKGKKTQQQAYGKQAVTPKSSQGHGPRLWANRRAG